MFRITRGMHVQHIHFPAPVFGLRDLDPDADENEPADADPPESAPAAAAEGAGETAADEA